MPPASLLPIVRWSAAVLVLALCGGASPARADEAAQVQALLQQGQTAEALLRVERALAHQPTDHRLRFLKGVILAEQGKSSEAIALFSQLVQERPELPEPYNNLGVVLAQSGQLDKARAAFEMAVRLKPDYATAHENLGDVHAKLAAQSYGRAADLSPGQPGVTAKLEAARKLASGRLSAPPPSGARR